MPVDTDTRLRRTTELIDDAPADPNPAARPLERTLVMEDAHPIDAVEYRGRHRAPGRPREPWNPDPAWFPTETTRDLGTPRFEAGVVAVPLERREPGASQPAEQVRPAKVSGVLAVLLRGAQWFRRDGGEDGS